MPLAQLQPPHSGIPTRDLRPGLNRHSLPPPAPEAQTFREAMHDLPARSLVFPNQKDLSPSHSDFFFFFFFPAFRLSVCARLCPIALSSRLSPSPYAPTRPHPEVPTLHGAGGRFASLHLPFRLTPGDSSCRCAGRWHKKQYTTAVTQARIKSGRATLWMDAQGRRGTGQPEPSSAIVVLSRSCIGPASAGARGASRRAAARTGSGSPPSALRPLPAQTCLGPAPTHSGDVRQRGGI